MLTLEHTPRTLIIYGAGVVGTEYASIFAGLGVKVDLVDNRANLLEFLDVEISDSLSYDLRNNGVRIRHNESYKTVTADDESVTLELESGKRLRADMLLYCNGRSGNTQGLGIENLGLETNSRGQLEIDDRYSTGVEGIYAAGDVVGWPSLASAAYNQGRSAATDLLGLPGFRFVDDVPTGIYTIPEISSLGTIEYFVNTTFNFPTMAEAYRVAAQLGLNRARQINP